MDHVSDAEVALHHVLLVGGTLAEWRSLSNDQWSGLLDDLGKAVDAVGGRWLTLRPLDTASPGASDVRRERIVGGCTVSADPETDGRRRFAAAAEAIRSAGGPIDEATLDERLNTPAQADPDLVVVLAPADRLPAALVWELAYGELVYLTVPWSSVTAEHLERAAVSYANRHRRFGGVE